MIGRRSLQTFFKAQLSAFLGGITDYLVMIACTESIGIHYTRSIAIGGIVGAAVNFSINRHWSFDAARQPVGWQLVRFIITVAGSILLKASLTFAVTEHLQVDYRLSRLCIELLVSIGFNFTLQKFWVFR
jgi:Predicted membrane protein